jgi:alkaline phosphatase D
MKKLWLIFYCMSALLGRAQQSSPAIVSGPMLGQVELRTAILWIEVTPAVKTVAVKYWKKDRPETARIKSYTGILGNEFNPVKMEIGALDMNQTYQYDFILDGRQSGTTAFFTTKTLWQWRMPAPDFSFLTGSCAYFNEAVYDRPGKPYGGDSSIFRSMAKENAAFMVWLGDNWYTREADYMSAWGLYYRASHDRSLRVLQPFWKAMPHYAIWDDHDYGPDDADGSYELKEDSRELFIKYWGNPSFGQDHTGIYTKISYSDVDIFLTDDRYFRSANDMADSLSGKPNPEKHFFGRKQLDWLENALLYSHASFKIIAVGSQVLNPINKNFECMHHYSAEYDEFMKFLDNEKIKGVLFLSGDRHHSEIIKAERPGNYTLYDITTSPFTSGISRVSGIELNNPDRLNGTLVEVQNYARITVSGPQTDRKLTVEFRGVDGRPLASWRIGENQLTQ